MLFFPVCLPFKVQQRTGAQMSPSRENACNTSVSWFINMQQSFCVVTNARGVNEIEWIQEVARRKEFISCHAFGANCVLATEDLRQLRNSVRAGRMQLFHQREREVSSRTTPQWSVIDTSLCLFFFNSLCAAANKKIWAFTGAATDFKKLQPAPDLMSSRIMTLHRQAERTTIVFRLIAWLKGKTLNWSHTIN